MPLEKTPSVPSFRFHPRVICSISTHSSSIPFLPVTVASGASEALQILAARPTEFNLILTVCLEY